MHLKKKTKNIIHIIFTFFLFFFCSKVELGSLLELHVLLVWMNQVGKGNVAVVSPPGTYDNMIHPDSVAAAGDHQQYGQAPPEYSDGLEDSGFSDAAIRRGEGLKKEGRGRGRNRKREKLICCCLHGQS